MFRIVSLFLVSLMFTASVAQATGKPLIVASDATWPPMEFLSADKEVIGYAPDYVAALAKETGLNLIVKNVAWDGIFAALASRQVTMIASSVTITEERKRKFAFTKPYCLVYQAVVVRKGDSIKSLAGLAGKTVGGQMGTTGLIQTMPKSKVDAIIKSYDEVGLAFESLARGDIFAVICDSPVAKFYANRRKDFDGKFYITYVTPESEEYGFALRKDDTKLVKLLNKGIDAMQAKGIEKKIADKWLGE